MSQIKPEHVQRVIELVSGLTSDGNAQLTILARAFALGCKIIGGVDKKVALKMIGSMLDEQVIIRPKG